MIIFVMDERTNHILQAFIAILALVCLKLQITVCQNKRQ